MTALAPTTHELKRQLRTLSLSGPAPRLPVASAAGAGGRSVDRPRAPAGDVFRIANQQRHGVSVMGDDTIAEVQFVATGRGARGLAISRDTTLPYVSGGLAGTISAMDFDSRKVVATWWTGGSPLQISPACTEVWASGRNRGEVYVLNVQTGELLDRIRAGTGPHGLTYRPQPGQFCVGHNEVYR